MKTQLPQHYREIFRLDLQKDKKTALLVNGLAILVLVLMIPVGWLAVPATMLFVTEDGMGLYIAKFAVLLGGTLAYLPLHELVHGIFMRCFSDERVHYGFTGLYAYAGSDAYFRKREYIIIALAPVILWGAVLAVLCPIVGPVWFWSVYFIQIANVSGSVGDLYVVCKFSRLPRDILVQDTGVAMTVYAP